MRNFTNLDITASNSEKTVGHGLNRTCRACDAAASVVRTIHDSLPICHIQHLHCMPNGQGLLALAQMRADLRKAANVACNDRLRPHREHVVCLERA